MGLSEEMFIDCIHELHKFRWIIKGTMRIFPTEIIFSSFNLLMLRRDMYILNKKSHFAKMKAYHFD